MVRRIEKKKSGIQEKDVLCCYKILFAGILLKLLNMKDKGSELSVGFWVAGSIQKVGGYFHFISPISPWELTY